MLAWYLAARGCSVFVGWLSKNARPLRVNGRGGSEDSWFRALSACYPLLLTFSVCPGFLPLWSLGFCVSAKQSHFCCQTDERGASSVSSPDVPSNILERFSSVKTGEGISLCVPGSGPSVPPAPVCCSVGWSQQESYF